MCMANILLYLTLAFVFAIVVWAVLTARRLDRLHIRLDRARDSLDAAITHRDVLVRVVDTTTDDAAAREALDVAQRQADLALRLYNDAVSATRAVRLKPGVRALGLAGTAPMPQFRSADSGTRGI